MGFAPISCDLEYALSEPQSGFRWMQSDTTDFDRFPWQVDLGRHPFSAARYALANVGHAVLEFERDRRRSVQKVRHNLQLHKEHSHGIHLAVSRARIRVPV